MSIFVELYYYVFYICIFKVKVEVGSLEWFVKVVVYYIFIVLEIRFEGFGVLSRVFCCG